MQAGSCAKTAMASMCMLLASSHALMIRILAFKFFWELVPGVQLVKGADQWP
jgi:hypothetical protein